ncbi:helix-turn-helix domain-containing protein [Streptomyces sp. NPDC048172]|uniref:helix-turn-helix domain-containing protein n=1 Tax=Streptomyces sp. NPDC048172 TaxID=3365505 RepID=UPI00371CC2D2
MAPDVGRSELADLLEELKQRSGRSYSALAHRSGLSRSSVHRYCQGSTVPPAFGAVELIARACGVAPGDAQLDRLYRAWQRANAEGDDADGDGASGAEEQAEPAPETEPESASPPDAGPDPAHPSYPSYPSYPLRAYVRLRTVTLVLAFVLATVASTLAFDRDRDPGGGPSGPGPSLTPSRQGERGPDWSVTGEKVPSAFFGVNVSSSTGEMPGFRTGSVRLWQSDSRWGTLEPRRGDYEWDTLDRTVEAAGKKKLPVLFTIGGTPPWATESKKQSDYGDSVAAPPDDLADWDRFVRKLATRYKGRIEAYELWDYPNHRPSFAGSMDTLAAMVRRASAIIEDVDGEATVVCPSFGELWTARGRRLVREFARTGAYRHCEAAAFKLPPRRADGPPEESIDLTLRMQRLLYEEGVRRPAPLWNTGPDKDVALRAELDGRRARDYAPRFYLSALYTWYQGTRRTYFYSWGSSEVPLVLELLEGPPTEAARRVERLVRWMDGAELGSCGRGGRMGLARDAYTCRLTRGDTVLRFYWTKRGRAETTLDDGARRVLHMSGRTERARPGARLAFGEEPVLIESRQR